MRIIITLLLFMTLSVDAWAATFKGRVIDADTKQPIEGAVVVASWREERATPTGPTTRFKDVKESLTDKNGEWIIKGPRGWEMNDAMAIFSVVTGCYFTNPPEFIVFKPGYCSWPEGFFIKVCEGTIKPEGNDKISEGVNVELLKLTRKVDRHRALPDYISGEGKGVYAAIENQKKFIKLINEESRYLGLEEYIIPKELSK